MSASTKRNQRSFRGDSLGKRSWARQLILAVMLSSLPFAISFQSYVAKIPNLGTYTTGATGTASGVPNPFTKTGTCQSIGHAMECGGLPSGGGNEFGKAFHQAAPATRWADICNDDSDEDGFTNGAELGDPQCIWTEGGTPTSTSGLSHPGMNCSIPTDPFCRNTGNTPAPISIPSESPTSNSTATSNTTGNTTGDNGSGQLALAATHSLAWLPPLILAAIFLM